ncbi:basic helix-loop-helix ARNT-like protein cyc isoform X3 [Lasioglossum baleicum]|uniref:basic helix-loop-helix ARNT-like protein cyc isoform X3 n=1 Tax=Lasioglossum baleicum TaxID=434251 RepID=UPI003FCCE2F4
MYALLDEGGLLPDSGGVVENDVVVGDGAGVNSCEVPQHHQQRLQRHRYYREQTQLEDHRQQYQQRQEEELEDLLCFRGPPDQEMVAQEMAQSYTQLLHPSQEPQEYISLEELQPRIHQDHHSNRGQVVTGMSSTGTQLYQHHQHHPPRCYYNLSAVQENTCSTVYFGDIGAASGVGEVSAVPAGGGDGLSLTPTPATNETTATTTTPSPNTTCATTVTITTTSTIAPATGNDNSNQGVVTGAEPPQPMETPPTMVPDQAPASGHHHYHHRHHHHHHHHHHRHNQQRSASTTPSLGQANTDTSDEFTPIPRKRKLSCHDGSDLLDDTGDDAKSVRTNDDSKKKSKSNVRRVRVPLSRSLLTLCIARLYYFLQNHSEIEKRRRDKMNTYITELSAMIPMCHAMSRKLDKLTVLRMAVQHLKTILGAVTSYTEGHYKPAFLSDQELKTLILQAAEGFVFVVGCDRGRILYVSESVLQTLNYSQGDLLGQSWFDILHPKDVAKVKEQLSSSDLSPRERLIDAKTMLPVKTDVPQGVSRLCPGARRSFFCRMKRKVESARCGDLQVKEEADTTSGCHRRKKQQNVDWKYCVIQCTGYLKSWAPAKIDLEESEGDGDGDACNLSCLVAVGRLQSTIPTSSPKKPRLRPIKFVSRHAMDGKFLFVDQRATLVLGFLPQELLGTSMYEYYHHDDIPHLAESHKAALQASECVTTQIYKFRTKGASFVRLQSEWKSFRNPWTKDIEYLIAKNSVASCDSRSATNSGARSEDSSVQGNYDYFTQSNGGLERLISSHIEVSKIGRQIAEEVLDLQRRGEDSSSGSSPGPGPEPSLLNTESQITTTASPERLQDAAQVTRGSSNSSSNPTPTYNHIANNLQLNSIANDQDSNPFEPRLIIRRIKQLVIKSTYDSGASPDEDMMDMIGGTTINESPNPVPSDGNDEAAMAVIMSLLEADAGLGGPVDFSGLPWPLP